MMKKCFSRFLSSQVLRGGKKGEIFTAGKKKKPTKAKTQHCSYLENSSAVGKKRNTKVWTLFLKCLHTGRLQNWCEKQWPACQDREAEDTLQRHSNSLPHWTHLHSHLFEISHLKQEPFPSCFHKFSAVCQWQKIKEEKHSLKFLEEEQAMDLEGRDKYT